MVYDEKNLNLIEQDDNAASKHSRAYEHNSFSFSLPHVVTLSQRRFLITLFLTLSLFQNHSFVSQNLIMQVFVNYPPIPVPNNNSSTNNLSTINSSVTYT